MTPLPGPDGGRPRAPILYRLLLLLLPGPLRSEFGREMERVFAARLDGAEGLGGRVMVWVHGVEDVLRAAVAERLERRAGRLERPEAAAGRLDAAGRSRTSRLSGLLEDLRLDLRFGARSLLRTPVPTLAAVLTLGLGLGAATGLFSVVNAVLLRPLPYAHPDRLVTINGPFVGAENLDEWRREAPLVEASAAYSIGSATARTPDGAVAVRVLPAGEGLLDLLGLRPTAGRPFLPSDHAADAAPVALVSEAFRRRWLGDDALGQTLRLDGRVHEVVGTLTEESLLRFRGLDVWVPLEGAGVSGLSLMARLAPGVEPADALEALIPLAERIATPAMQERVEGLREMGVQVAPVRVTSARDALLLGIGDTLWLLFAAGGLVLLLAVVNVAALLLGGAVDRSDELAVRMALGAGRHRLVRQLLAEATLLGGLGAGLGLTLAAAVPWLLAVAPDVLPRAEGVGLDGTTALFAVLAAAVCVAFLGTFPGMMLARSGHGLVAGGQRTTRVRGAGRVQEGLAVVQIAAALVLVVGSALLLRTYLVVRPSEPGFVIEDRTVVELRLPEEAYGDEAAQRRFVERILEEMRIVPGVADVALATDLPLTGESMLFPAVAVEGASPEGERPPNVHTRAVSAGYLGLMGMELVAGRGIEPSDAAGAPTVSVVNESAAQRLFGEGVPVLGRAFTLEVGDREVRSTVVGILRDAWVLQGPRPRPEVFLPFEQVPFRRFKVVLANVPGVEPDASRLRSALASVDPGVAPREISPFSELSAWSFALPRFQAMLLGVLAFLTLVLAAAGCFGVLSRLVTGRTRELGIRMALGARFSHVLALVLGRAAILATLGIVIGAVLARSGTRLLQAHLHGVTPGDPASFAAAAGVLLLTVTAAAAHPAVRAARTDPARTLREE